MEWEHEDIIIEPQEQCREDTEVLVEAVQQGVQPWAVASLRNHRVIPHKLKALSLDFKIQPSTHNRVLDHPPTENKILLILADVHFSLLSTPFCPLSGF